MLGSCSQVLVRIEREMKIPSLTGGHELWEVTERKRDTSGRIAAASLRSDSERCQLSWLGHLILMPAGLLTTKLFQLGGDRRIESELAGRMAHLILPRNASESPEKMENLAGERVVWIPSLGLVEENGYMDISVIESIIDPILGGVGGCPYFDDLRMNFQNLRSFIRITLSQPTLHCHSPILSDISQVINYLLD